jgi:hypothetical protein
MIATAPQPLQSLQSSQVDSPTYIEVVKAILSETLNAQGLGVDDMDV